MAWALCEVSDGLRPAEACVKLVTYHGRPEYMPVDRGMIDQIDGKDYLSVQVIHIDTQNHAVLISLPIEADSGAHRAWLRMEDMKPGVGLPAELFPSAKG